MHKIATLLFFGAMVAPMNALGQEVAAPGIVADFTEVDTIVVTALRIEDPLPLPYASYVRPDDSSYIVEEVGGQRIHQYTRALITFSDHASFVYRRRWTEEISHSFLDEDEDGGKFLWRF